MRSLSVSHKRPLSQKEASQRASRSLESFCQTLGFSNRRRRPRVPATNLGRRLFHLLLLPPNLRLLSFRSFRRSLASDCRHRQIRDAHASERAELRAGAEQFAAIDSKFTPPSPVSQDSYPNVHSLPCSLHAQSSCIATAHVEAPKGKQFSCTMEAMQQVCSIQQSQIPIQCTDGNQNPRDAMTGQCSHL